VIDKLLLVADSSPLIALVVIKQQVVMILSGLPVLEGLAVLMQYWYLRYHLPENEHNSLRESYACQRHHSSTSKKCFD
jgi:hypothetical protein